MTVGILAMGFYIPEELLPCDKLEEIAELSPEDKERFSLLDIHSIPLERELDSVDMAIKASEKALYNTGLTPGEIDMIIYLQSRSPDYLMSSEATRFQEQLGASRALSFSVNDLGCADVNNALQIASRFLQRNDGIENVLIAYGSKPFGKRRYRKEVTVIGDAGMSLILSRPGSHRILGTVMRTEGKFWDLYKVDYKNKVAEEYEETCTNLRYKFELSIASRNMFKELNEQLLQEQDLKSADGYIMQNLSISAFAFNEKAMELRLAQSCYQNCSRYGHLGNIDIFLNYYTSVMSGEFQPGDRILIMNNSPVACWASLLMEV